MISKELFDLNLKTFKEFSIGDKVAITTVGHAGFPEVQEIGFLTQFGYNCTDELILGITIILGYDKAPPMRWLHPLNKLSIVTKL